MSETTWQRLHRLVEDRRHSLGLTQAALEQAGAPTPRWLQIIRDRAGAPTHRMRRPLRQLDKALGWPDSTSWRIASGEIAEPDPVDELASQVARRWRELPAADRPAFEARILAAIDGP